jgi:hypothetical protein
LLRLWLKGARPKNLKILNKSFMNKKCEMKEAAHLDMRDQQDGCRSEQGQQTQKITVNQN